MVTGDEWLSGRKKIADYLDVSPRKVSALRICGAPIVIEGGTMKAKPSDLDEWRRRRDEGRCPRDGAPCPNIGGVAK